MKLPWPLEYGIYRWVVKIDIPKKLLLSLREEQVGSLSREDVYVPGGEEDPDFCDEITHWTDRGKGMTVDAGSSSLR